MPVLGRDLTLGVNMGSSVTDDYLNLTYTAIANTTAKALSLSPNTVDATSDASNTTTQTMVTRLDAELTATVQLEKKNATTMPVVDTIVYLNNQIMAGDQPTMWCHIAGENSPLEVYGWVVITGCDISSNTDEIITADLTYKPAAIDGTTQGWYMSKVTA